MSQDLDTTDFPPIRFEHELLPQSVSGISILMNYEFTETTGDWIWKLPHCKNTWKEGDSTWCISSCSEIISFLNSNKEQVIEDIKERLSPHGFDPNITLNEWLSSLARIKEICQLGNKTCRWIAL
ncbi:hypothetical protein [Rubritalea sp.]|uniref:hypothetical protein n=1 Tax=Rubritalea sp. TaxID=2109375 RepID=UPI003EF3605B